MSSLDTNHPPIPFDRTQTIYKTFSICKLTIVLLKEKVKNPRPDHILPEPTPHTPLPSPFHMKVMSCLFLKGKPSQDLCYDRDAAWQPRLSSLDLAYGRALAENNR